MDQAKSVQESLTEQVQIVMPGDSNGYGRLFGGRLVEWIDVVACVSARRHAGHNVTTASIDHLSFSAPAYINDTILLRARLTYVGKTSMEVKVETFVETLNGKIELVNTAYLTIVALDDKKNPVPVPRLLLETDAEQKEWSEAERRRAIRNAERRPPALA